MPPPDYNITQYENDKNLQGGNSSRMTVVCNWSDREAVRALFLGLADPYDATLLCTRGNIRFLGNDSATGKAEIQLEYISGQKVNQRKPDLPMKFRVEVSGESVTISGSLKWASDGAVLSNSSALPCKHFTIARVVLYGTKSAFSLAAYSAYCDKVNNDSFLGAAAETVRFASASASERLDPTTGLIVYDVEVNLEWKPSGWNNFWREKPPRFDGIRDQAGNKLYPSTSFAGLLT
jgi:hypothetical protein